MILDVRPRGEGKVMAREFHMNPESVPAAMERIVEDLTEPQQVALVSALRQARKGVGLVRVSTNERTIGSLLRGPGPLIEEAGKQRFLTSLGTDVARYLAETRQFSPIPDISQVIPKLPKPKGK